MQQKSEGVFLWVVLALNELISGFDNRNSVEELFQTLDELHPGLNRLYKQMWDRRNGDQPFFRRQAAEVLWLACQDCKLCLSYPSMGDLPIIEVVGTVRKKAGILDVKCL